MAESVMTPSSNISSSSTDQSDRHLFALLYKFEGQDAKRLKRTYVYSPSVSPEEINSMLHNDGVDLRRFRVRIFDEHFQGWMANEDNIELQALRTVQPAGAVQTPAHVLEVMLEPMAPIGVAPPWASPHSAWRCQLMRSPG